jgi:hypothetical protein
MPIPTHADPVIDGASRTGKALTQRAEQRATEGFRSKQDAAVHQGRKQGSFAMPAKKQSREATGGYVGTPSSFVKK